MKRKNTTLTFDEYKQEALSIENFDKRTFEIFKEGKLGRIFGDSKMTFEEWEELIWEDINL